MEDKGFERIRKIFNENAMQRGKMQESLRGLEFMRRDLALDGSSTYEELFEKVLQLAKSRRILSTIDMAMEAGPLFILAVLPFNSVLIPVIVIIIYEIFMLLIKRKLNKEVSSEKRKPYFCIATISLFDIDYTKLNNNLMKMRNNVHGEYEKLLKLVAEMNNDNIDTNESVEGIITTIDNSLNQAQSTSRCYNSGQEIGDANTPLQEKPTDKVKKIGNPSSIRRKI